MGNTEVIVLSLPRIPNSLVGQPLSPRWFSPRRSRARAAVALVTVLFVVFAQGVGTSVVHGSAVAARTARLNPTGIGTVQFGAPKGQTVTWLRALFGAPTWQGANTGCGPRFVEVEWGDFVAEFRAKVFTGYRYIKGGYPVPNARAGRNPSQSIPFPHLATAKGITLGSTLATLRQRYGTLQLIGADDWRADNGLIFVDNARRDPVPPSSRIIEVKINTCGAY